MSPDGTGWAADLLNEKAAARIADVHPRTLRRMRAAGTLAYLRTATGRIRYTLADVQAAFAHERVEAVSKARRSD